MSIQNEGKNIYQELAERCADNLLIDKELYTTHKVYRGLRDLNGVGVVAGLTKISTVNATKTVDGKRVPCDGQLFYRGIDVKDLCQGFLKENRLGFEEAAYLLLFGRLPSSEELAQFCKLLAKHRTLPKNFVRDVIMKASEKDMMNTLSRGILTLASYDRYADNTEISNVLRQSITLISVMPMLAVYSYHSYNHYKNNRSLYIHRPKENLSTAENILRMLRADKQYTALEAKILDLALVLHMEHGGGNNSSFTTHVVSSSGTDTYSAITAALCSLKGPKHGGANIKVMEMFADLKKNVKNTRDEGMIADYLRKLLHKEAFDRKGLIYGLGHAVYSISDPRAVIFKSFVEQLAKEKGREAEYQLYATVDRLAPQIIAEERKIYKGVSVNVDFYSGLVYSLLGLPVELYTPMFAIARVVGWSAHRMEELSNQDKIIRPSYVSVQDTLPYTPIGAR